jgi:glycine/D-amino acid oxidase-like deaminating enzyme
MATNRDSNNPSYMPSLPVPHSTRSYWHMTNPNDLVNHRTTPDLLQTASVVIIGSGISGAFAANELNGRGIRDIVVLEAREICSGATGRNGGHCQPLCYDQLAEVGDFELKNIAYLSGLIKDNDIKCDFSPFPDGGCHAYFSQELFDSVKAKIMAMKHDAPHLAGLIQVIEDPSKLAALKIPTAIGAVLQAKAAALHPYKLVTYIWSKLLSNTDLNLQTTTPVTAISKASSSPTSRIWTVHTPRGSITTAHVLLATNAYTAHLLPSFRGLIVPVQGQMSALKPTPHALQHPLQHDYGFRGIMEQDHEEDDYLVQRPVNTGGEFMFGGGRVVAKNAAVGVSDDSYVDERVRMYLRRMLPKLMNVYGKHSDMTEEIEKLPEKYAAIEKEGEERDMEPLAEWTGIMGYSRDGHPWVGGVPGMEGLWVCAGYTGHGMPNTSLCGRHIASLVAADVKGQDWRLVEKDAVKSKDIPECYVLSQERMEKARELQEIKGNVAEMLEKTFC